MLHRLCLDTPIKLKEFQIRNKVLNYKGHRYSIIYKDDKVSEIYVVTQPIITDEEPDSVRDLKILAEEIFNKYKVDYHIE